MQFDMYELCTTELQAKLKPMRDKFDAEEERKNEERAAFKLKGGDAAMNKKAKLEDVEYESYEFDNGKITLLSIIIITSIFNNMLILKQILVHQTVVTMSFKA